MKLNKYFTLFAMFFLFINVSFSQTITTSSGGELLYNDSEVVLEEKLLEYYNRSQVDSQINTLENQTQSLENEVSNFFDYGELVNFFYEKDEVYNKNETDSQINALELENQNIQNEISTFFDYSELVAFFYEKDEVYNKNETDSQINALENETQSLRSEISSFFNYEELITYFYERNEVYNKNETDLLIDTIEQNFNDETNTLNNITQDLQSQIDVIDGNTFNGDYNDLTNQPDLSVYTLVTDFEELESGLENNYYNITEVDSQIDALDNELNDLKNITQEEYYTKDEVDNEISNLESSMTTDTNETPRVDDLYDIVGNLTDFSGDYDDLTNKPDLDVYDDALLDLENNYYDSAEVDSQLNVIVNTTEDLQSQIDGISGNTFSGDYEDLTNKPDLDVYNDSLEIDILSTDLENNYYNTTEVDIEITNLQNSMVTDTNETLRVDDLYNIVGSLNNFSGNYSDLLNQPDLSVYNQSSDINNLNTNLDTNYYNKSETYNRTEVESLVNNVDVSSELSNYYNKSETYNVSEINNINLSLSNDLSNLENEVNSLNNFSGNYSDLVNKPNLSVYNQSSEIDSLNTNLNTNYYNKSETYNRTEVDREITNLQNSMVTDTNETLRVDDLYNIVGSLNNFSGNYSDLTNLPNLDVYNNTLEIDILSTDLENNYYNITQTYNRTEVESLVNNVDVSSELSNYYNKSETYNVSEINNINLSLSNDLSNLENEVNSLNNFSGNYSDLVNKPNLSVYNQSSEIDSLNTNLNTNYYNKSETYNRTEVDREITNLQNSMVTDTNETLRVDDLYNIVGSLNNFSGNYSDLLNQPDLSVYNNTLEIDILSTDLENNYYNITQTYNRTEVESLVNNVDVSSELSNYYNKSETYNVSEINNINLSLSNDLSNLENEVNSLNNFSGNYSDLVNKPNLSVYNQSSEIDSLNSSINQKLDKSNLNGIFKGSETLAISSSQNGVLKVNLGFGNTFSSNPQVFISIKDSFSNNNVYSHSILELNTTHITLLLKEEFDGVFENDITIDWLAVE